MCVYKYLLVGGNNNVSKTFEQLPRVALFVFALPMSY